MGRAISIEFCQKTALIVGAGMDGKSAAAGNGSSSALPRYSFFLFFRTRFSFQFDFFIG
jgi:hypothetical protein